MNPLRTTRGRWHPVRLLAIGLGFLAAAAPAMAVQPRHPDSPLAQKEFFRPELYISVSHQELDEVLQALPNKAAWQSFVASRGRAVEVYIDPRSGAATNIVAATPLIPGSGVGNQITRESLGRRLGRSVEQVDQEVVAAAVLGYVRAHQDVLGIDVSQLGAVRATQVTRELWQIHIPQERNGIPVRDGRLAASISHGNLVVIGTETWGNVAIDTSAGIPAEGALAAGFAYAEGPTADDKIVRAPRLEIAPIAPPEYQQGEGFAGPVGRGYQHRLVWTFVFQRLPDDARWEVLVDAQSGEVLAFQDANQYADFKGGVYPVTNNEICPIPGRCGIMQPGFPMPFADTGFAAPNNFTNSAGVYNWPGGTATTTLNGRHVRITDTCGPISASSATGSIDLGGTNGQHDCVTPGTGGAGNTASSRSAFYEVNKITEMARGYLPGNTWAATFQIPTNVNLNATCNAFYSSGNGSINFYRSGGGCRNTGEMAGVFDHEWGHALDDNDANGTLSNSSEGYADIAAIYRYQDSCVGHGFWWTSDRGCGMTPDGTGFNANEAQTGPAHCSIDCSGVRDSDWEKHTPNTPDTALGYVCANCLASSGPCGRQVHCAGAPQRQAAWDFVARDLVGPPFNLDIQTRFIIGNKLFYQGSGNIGLWYACTCGGTSNACGATNGYMQWITADDDNGNLNDGTPHMTAIHAAFDRHGIACATPAPTNSGCAAGPSVAPTLVASPGNNQVSLSWNAVAGATRYWVFRTEGHAGCNYGKALIAEVTGLSYVDTQVGNGRPYSYNVVAAGASSSCYSPASACQTVTPVSAPGPLNLAASPTAPNQITLTWTAVPGAASYRVYRAVGSCPQSVYTQLATGVPGPTYVDNTVSGGTTYAYVVTWVDAGNSESGFSNCDDALATGNCTLPPTFAGATSVTQPTPGVCRLDVHWAAGATSCGGTLLYNVYRSTDPAFIPSAANLRQSCVNALTFADNTVLSGNTYYYIVRAEDSTTSGNGPCNLGNQDGNLVRKSGNPDVINTFFDDMESGPALWTVDNPGPGNPFAIVTTQSNSPTHSWFVDDPPTITDQRIAFANPVTIGSGSPMLSFFHRYDMELGPPPYDGGVLEFSLNGTNWFDILDGTGPIPPNAGRMTGHLYQVTPISTGFQNPLGGRRAWSGAQNTFVETLVNMADFAGQSLRLRWRRGTDNSVSAVGWWIDDVRISQQQACVVPSQSVAAQALAVDAAGNGVLQPNETVEMAPTWRNTGNLAITLTGATSAFAGPAGGTYNNPDSTGAYGTIAVGGQAACTDCYTVEVAAASRPVTHWDSTILETVNPTATTKTWTLHIGDSFTDVLPSSSFYRFIETILHHNVTGGCTATTYCPLDSTTREQMAVFVLVSNDPGAPPPPACVAGSEQFADVPASSPFCRWVEELFNRGVVTGCGGGNYCPLDPATREQMAVFVLRTLDPALNPPSCITGSEMFADVPATSPFCKWIQELARRGVVTGCGGGNYCPTADVTREQMSVFLSVTFSLALYGL